MSKLRSLFLLSAIGAATSGHAASVANLTCTGAQGAVSMNLSYFGIGATLTAPAANSNPTLNSLLPLELHAALGSFQTLFQAVAAGTPFSTCVLNTQASGGAIQFTFTSVYVQNITAAATSSSAMAPRTAYVDASLLYATVSVTQAGTTVDDGGTSVPPAWDVGVGKTS